jgi:DNA-binding MarR family transcriptional regulator
MYEAVMRLFDEVRLLDHRLIQAAEELHADLAISAPSRAVLEYLEREGPTSVPAIARARYVTRQHIQATVDALADGGLVRRAANPAHRRSPLVELTAVGAKTIKTMHDRERRLLEQRLATVAVTGIGAAAAVLAAIRAALDAEAIR